MSTAIVLPSVLAHVAYHLVNALTDPMEMPGILRNLAALSAVNVRAFKAAYPDAGLPPDVTARCLLDEMCSLGPQHSPLPAEKALGSLRYNFGDAAPEEWELLEKIERQFTTTVWDPWFAEWAAIHLPGLSLRKAAPEPDPEEPGPSSAQRPLFGA